MKNIKNEHLGFCLVSKQSLWSSLQSNTVCVCGVPAVDHDIKVSWEDYDLLEDHFVSLILLLSLLQLFCSVPAMLHVRIRGECLRHQHCDHCDFFKLFEWFESIDVVEPGNYLVQSFMLIRKNY